MSNSKNNKRVEVKEFLFFTILFSLTISLNADFIKSGDVVVDNKTCLVWQDNSATNTTRAWQHAVDYCKNLDLDSHNDWRLPNINELKTIIDRNKSNPAIVDGFKNIRSDRYWSSTSSRSDSSSAFFVDFNNGSISMQFKGYDSDQYSVRCVRDGE